MDHETDDRQPGGDNTSKPSDAPHDEVGQDQASAKSTNGEVVAAADNTPGTDMNTTDNDGSKLDARPGSQGVIDAGIEEAEHAGEGDEEGVIY